MKTCHNLFMGVGFFILCCTMFTACVNHISEEEGEIINNGDIPLKFVADIHEIMNTRVVNNSFGEKDEVGLFALAGTTTMQENVMQIIFILCVHLLVSLYLMSRFTIRMMELH